MSCTVRWPTLVRWVKRYIRNIKSLTAHRPPVIESIESKGGRIVSSCHIRFHCIKLCCIVCVIFASIVLNCVVLCVSYRIVSASYSYRIRIVTTIVSYPYHIRIVAASSYPHRMSVSSPFVSHRIVSYRIASHCARIALVLLHRIRIISHRIKSNRILCVSC